MSGIWRQNNTDRAARFPQATPCRHPGGHGVRNGAYRRLVRVRQPTARILAVLTSVATALALGACTVEAGTPGPGASVTFPLPPPPTGNTPLPVPSVSATLPALAPLPVPDGPYPVSRRILELSHDDRPLRTVVLFPSGDYVDGAFDVAAGRFPVVLFSHGLRGSPELYESRLARIAEAGFIVVAPTYPHTSTTATSYDPLDVLNQPDDASAVLTAVLELAETDGDRLAGHLDEQRIAAIGHSAGGYTTTGLLSTDRDARIRAAVVLAGSSLSGAFTGPATPVLLVHGDGDAVVPYSYGRTTYGQVPWPKAFLTVIDGGHADYLTGGSPASTAVTDTVLDFLRATLYGDADALARIPTGAAVDGVTRFESTIAFPTATPTSSLTPSPTAQPSLTPTLETTPSPSTSESDP